MKISILVILSAIVFSVSSFAVSADDFIIYNDFDTGFELAEILDKNVLLVFTSSSCPYCTMLIEDVINSREVLNFLRANYIVIEIRADDSKIGHFDVENTRFDINGKEFNYEEFFHLFGVRGVPATIFFNRELEFLGGFPGFLPATDYLKWLKYVETKSYEKGDIDSFENDAMYNGKLRVKAISENELSEVEEHLSPLLSYFTYSKFRETNLITIDPFMYYVVRESNIKQVEDYLAGLDKKTIYSVYVVE